MSRTWLLRGGAAAVFGVLVGAWAVGLATGIGDTAPPPQKITSPVEPDDSVAPVIHRSIVVEKAEPRRTREADPTQEAVTEPGTDAAEEPGDDTSDQPDPTSPAPTTPAGPSDGPSDPSPSSPHAPSPPADDCDNVVDCALDPITGHP
jgi:hypothetical protein